MADFVFHFHYLLAIQSKMLTNKLHFFLCDFYYVELDVCNSRDPSVIAIKREVGHRYSVAIITFFTLYEFCRYFENLLS